MTSPTDHSQPDPAPASTEPAGAGLSIERVFSAQGVHPFDEIAWEKRSAAIKDEKGAVIFEQNDAEVPASWSQLATNVVVSKYFYGEHDTPERENSVRQLVHRVTRTIADWAKQDGLFASDADAETFYDELTWLCVNQYGAFNSPVWFNVGLLHQHGVAGGEGNFHIDPASGEPTRTLRGYEYPQASACFIQSVQDNMESIMALAHSEAMLFKFGSGTGTDLSTLRSSREKLSGGGRPSGPLSFMRVYDQIAAVVKSGGKTRRAAKMQSLRCDHPDIKEFIEAKPNEEKKAWALIEQGYDGSFNGEAYASIMYQNSNFSIRVTDEFMRAGLNREDWQTYEVTSGAPSERYKANELLDGIAEGTRVCGDPGIQYHTTVNRWHTCPNSGPINASNPCSEYMFLDDSACNLASLNLLRFRREDGSFDVERFRHAVRVFVIAQEVLIDHASYPTAPICRNSHEYRPLGLGYANLGALLMSLGLPYDGDAGRAWAGAITAIMTGQAYTTSAELAGQCGTFLGFPPNREPMLRVMGMHRQAVDHIQRGHVPAEMLTEAAAAWEQAIAAGQRHGYRNAQVTVLAPTGTIGFMMDCDTTGIEPEIALVKYKQLAGGGMFKIVNRTVPLALRRLGYSGEQVSEIIGHIEERDTIEGAPHIRDRDLAVFDCAFKAAQGQRSIHYMGHIRMMAAVQPFLSGAISKTVNMPKESSQADIRQVYVDAWKLGLKAVAIYRDGSKRVQPLNTTSGQKKAQPVQAAPPPVPAPRRRRMPATAMSTRHKFDIAGHEGYLHVGMLEDGAPGEIFITMAKEGSTVGGMTDAFATAISLCLQYGVPLEDLVRKFSHQRFEPNGMTANREIPFAKSIVDYIFRWLGLEFLEEFRKDNQLRRPEPQSQTQPTLEGLKADAPASPMAAPEAVTEDNSDLSRVDVASDKEVTGPVDALDSSGNGQGGTYKGGNGQARGAVAVGPALQDPLTRRISRSERVDMQFSHFQEDAPACDVCGSITVRNGNCYKCFNCGSSLGCS